MVDNIERLKDTLVDGQANGKSQDQDKQAQLLKLAERTVLQAEILAQEIIERAKQESEAASAKMIEEAAVQAREEVRNAETEAREITERSRREIESEAARIRDESKAQAQVEARRVVESAQLQSSALTSAAKAAAQWESQEILATAQQQAITLTIESKARAAAIESGARSRAEFIVRMTQNVAEGISRAIAATCDDSEADFEELENQFLEDHVPNVGQDDGFSGGASRNNPSAKRKTRTTHGSRQAK
ncbi:MAG: hypothetical protein IH962_03170 [Chloroflexi bacterium]|nr:hypothetical protein [Chloroflexota bacterium]